MTSLCQLPESRRPAHYSVSESVFQKETPNLSLTPGHGESTPSCLQCPNNSPTLGPEQMPQAGKPLQSSVNHSSIETAPRLKKSPTHPQHNTLLLQSEVFISASTTLFPSALHQSPFDKLPPSVKLSCELSRVGSLPSDLLYTAPNLLTFLQGQTSDRRRRQRWTHNQQAQHYKGVAQMRRTKGH